MAELLSEWCNIFGGEGSNVKNLGGLGSAPTTNWYCPTRAVGHFYMQCQHGHKGQIMPLCEKHYKEFRNGVEFCPRCNAEPPGHRCRLTLEHVS